jgi:hypothetical protein
MRRRLSRYTLVLVLLVGVGSAACTRNPNPQPPLATDNHAIPVPYHTQEYMPGYSFSFWCGPASVQMWEHYEWGSYHSQSDIWNAMATYDPWNVSEGWGVDADGVADAVNYFVYDMYWGDPWPTFPHYYQDIKLEVGAIADALDQQEPTIAMVNSGTHWVIAKGGHWDKTPYDQPNANYLTINDPDMGATIHYMMNDWQNKVGSAKITVAGDHDNNAYQGVQSYDAMGGTYYGDENPPECVRNCEPQEDGWLMPGLGTRVTSVLATLFERPYTLASRTRGAVVAAGKNQNTGPSLGWRMVASAVQGRQFRPRTTKLGPEKQASGPRKYVYVPHAYTTKKSEIIENALAGLQQAHIDVEPKLRSVVHDKSFVVSAVRPVEAQSYGPNYFHLTFSDANGRPYAVARVDDVGWLLSVAALDDIPPLPDDDEIATLLQTHGKGRGHGVRWVQMLSKDVGTTDALMPLAVVQGDDGSTVYVNHRRQVFVLDDQGDIAVSTKAGAVKLRRLSR